MIPAVLAAARRRLGLTQAQLAAAAGVARNTLARWEVGRYRPRRAEGERLRAALAWLGRASRGARDLIADGAAAIIHQARPDVLLLWEYSAADAAAAAELHGPGALARADYLVRLAEVEARAAGEGLAVRRVRATVAELRAVLARRRLANTPDGRATALVFLSAK